MGKRSEFVCRDCLASFEADVGGGSKFRLKRCAKCGKAKAQKLGAKPALKCECGGKLQENLPPICPKCRSRKVAEVAVKYRYD